MRDVRGSRPVRRAHGTPWSWWSRDRGLLHTVPPGSALFAPGRACDIASDVPCRDPPRTEPRLRAARSPSLRTAGDPLPPPPRQRLRLRRIRTPSIVRVLPPPVAQDALALARGITRSPPPVSLLACWWLSPPRSGFRRLFAGCARPPRGVRASQLDPWSYDLDRAPLVDFCNRYNPRAPPR